jgi:N-acetylglucosamine malate deacetylase 2
VHPTSCMRVGQVFAELMECVTHRRSLELPITIVVAHPDDETIGAGVLLGHLPYASLVIATDGAPRDRRYWPPEIVGSREQYAQTRRREIEEALAQIGWERSRIAWLGFADQELTDNLEQAAGALSAVLFELRPELIVTQPFEGGHPDHDATAFIVHAAAALYQRAGLGGPALVEMTSYHGAAGRWIFGSFLGAKNTTLELRLTAEEVARKRSMLAAYRSQAGVLGRVDRFDEHFRLAPSYDFGQPPHTPPLLYESMGWPMQAQQFCRAARHAARALGLAELAPEMAPQESHAP